MALEWRVDSELLLVGGVILLIIAIPAVISSFTHAQPPKLAFVFFALGTALIGAAVYQKPGGYTFDEITKIFVNVIKHALS